MKRQEERKNSILKPLSAQEQKACRDKMRESRAKDIPVGVSSSEANENFNQDREPDLMKYNVPMYDIKLFQEAQAIASEKLVSVVYYEIVGSICSVLNASNIPYHAGGRIEKVTKRARNQMHRNWETRNGGLVPESISGGVYACSQIVYMRVLP